MNNKGVAPLVWIIGIAIVGLVAYVEGPRLVANVKVKDEVKQTDVAVKETVKTAAAEQTAVVVEKKADTEAGGTILRDAIEGSAATGKLPPGAPADFVGARFDSITQTAIQMFGPPSATNSAQWRALALAALSENTEDRVKAQTQVAAQMSENQALTQKLKDSQAAVDAAVVKTQEAQAKLVATDSALQSAQKNLDDQTGLLAKLKRYAIYALIAWLLFQGLTLLAKTNPALAPVVAGINAVVSPALALAHSELGKAWTAAKAETADLATRVGSVVAQVRHETPVIAKDLTTKLDTAMDKAQQSAIGQAAEAELAKLRAEVASDAEKAKAWLAGQPVAPSPVPPVAQIFPSSVPIQATPPTVSAPLPAPHYVPPPPPPRTPA